VWDEWFSGGPKHPGMAPLSHMVYVVGRQASRSPFSRRRPYCKRLRNGWRDALRSRTAIAYCMSLVAFRLAGDKASVEAFGRH
jgi:hypothetical protein